MLTADSKKRVVLPGAAPGDVFTCEKKGPEFVPLPDFFTGAHVELMGWKLATRDVERYRIYFPAVELIEPKTTW